MREYKLGDLALVLTSAMAASRDLLAAEEFGKDRMHVEYCENLAVMLDGLAICCTNFNADSSLITQLRSFEASLKANAPDARPSVLHTRLATLIEGIQNNLELRKFMFVPADQAHYWDNVELFGDEFLISFPTTAVMEMYEAGNCYAAGRSTACVFHCMRVAEHGLRRLANKVRIKITHKGKTCPLEYGDWDKVITAIKNKILEVRQRPKGPKAAAALQLYSDLADHCEYMKDIWRNELSHTRRRYNKAEALAVINRVREFVQLLARHEAPREIKKRAAKLKRIESIRFTYDTLLGDSTQRTQSEARSGKTGEVKSEKGETSRFPRQG